MNFMTEKQKIQTTVIRDLEALHPVCKTAFRELEAYLQLAFKEGATHSQFGVFETYRHPLRQLYLLEHGTTKAGIYKSAHQFGLAVDFVPFKTVEGKRHWSWSKNEDWGFLRKSAELYGLTRPIAWDLAHVQHPAWREMNKHMP